MRNPIVQDFLPHAIRPSAADVRLTAGLTRNRRLVGSSRAALHSLFEEQAALRPNAEAARDQGGGVSYGELDRRANQLAHLLRARGVQSGALVGICFDRSVSAVVAVLGILKAGGAYVPLDSEYPGAWIEHVLSDSQVEQIVTLRVHADRLALRDVDVVCLDDSTCGLQSQPTTRPEVRVASDSPAYVIYTSGSTGMPKGVVVEHGSAVHSTRCRLDYYPGQVERFAMLPSLAFDASVAAIFWTLAQGGTLCFPPSGAERDPAQLSRWVRSHAVTHWLSVPVLYRLMLERSSEALQSLRVVVLGGETCPPSLVRTHLAVLPQAGLFNEYGPTEAAVWSTVYHCQHERSDALVPIGRAIAGAELYVLDEQRRVVEDGEIGELYIGGPGVAREYWRRPELTAERFLPNPFSLLPGERLYRTGDLVRRLDDGNLEFLGRADDQHKVRGHRVELGQVEAALCALPGVAQAVVVTRTLTHHDQLVAYLLPQPGVRLSTLELRESLAERLPAYMHPSQYFVVESLPQTPNGKIDRGRLIQQAHNSFATRVSAMPCDDDQRKMIAIWETTFDQTPLSMQDDFFELGGDSLLAAAIFARIETEFGPLLPPETLLEHSTIGQLTDFVKAAQGGHVAATAIRLCEGQGGPPLFCLPGIGGHVLEFREFSHRLRGTRTLYGLRPRGLEDGLQPHESIEEMAAHAIEQMRRVQPHGPYALVGYSLGGNVAFEMAHQLTKIGQSIEFLALLDSRLWSPPRQLNLWQKLRLHAGTLYHSTGEGRRSYLLERCRVLLGRLRHGRISAEEDDVVLGLDLNPASRAVARTHWRAWRAYRPHLYDGAVTLFIAAQHPSLADDANRDDSTLGWDAWSRQAIDVVRVDSTHAEMLHPKHAQVIAAAIAGRLAADGRSYS